MELQCKPYIHGRWQTTARATPNEVAQWQRFSGPGQNGYRDLCGKASRRQFRADLRGKAVLPSRFQISRRHKRASARPRASTTLRAKQSLDGVVERCRKAAQIIQAANSGNRQLQIPNTSFRPGPFETADCPLRKLAKPHFGIDEDVVDMLIAVQVQGEDMGVLVTMRERLPLRVATGHLGA